MKSLLYEKAKHFSLRKSPPPRLAKALGLTCARVDARCPGFKYCASAPCSLEPPNLVDQIFHHTIPPEGRGTHTFRGRRRGTRRLPRGRGARPPSARAADAAPSARAEGASQATPAAPRR